jgi:hypothetical protein
MAILTNQFFGEQLLNRYFGNRAARTPYVTKSNALNAFFAPDLHNAIVAL